MFRPSVSETVRGPQAFVAVLAVFSLSATPAFATEAWAVLPVRGERPPPRDPTLMRLTEAIAASLESAIGAPTRIVARELADEACPSETGECPRDVALFVSAAHAVSVVLREDQSAVDLRVYVPKTGLARTVTLACAWVAGRVACNGEALAQLAAPGASVAVASADAPAKASARRGRASAESPPVDPVDALWAAASEQLRQCKKQGWGDAPREGRPEAFTMRFRTTAEGVLRDVRLEPAGFTDVPALACMARVVESIRVPAGVLGEGVHRRPLP